MRMEARRLLSLICQRLRTRMLRGIWVKVTTQCILPFSLLSGHLVKPPMQTFIHKFILTVWVLTNDVIFVWQMHWRLLRTPVVNTNYPDQSHEKRKTEQDKCIICTHVSKNRYHPSTGELSIIFSLLWTRLGQEIEGELYTLSVNPRICA